METTRFNHDANINAEAIEYIENRAKQLLRHNYFLTSVEEKDWGVSAFFEKEGKRYQSIYILKQHRKKGIYKQQVIETILTSIGCNIADYLHVHNIDCVVEELNPFYEYDVIAAHYGNDKAKRSGVPFMNHIDEGLAILNWIKAPEEAKKAYCLHPIYQSDKDLYESYGHRFMIGHRISPQVLILTMEYRNIANAYLSPREIKSIEEIKLSPLKEVNDMLIADKIQNRKDFELYHEGNHPRSKELAQYFKNWLERLGISEAEYQHYKKLLTVLGK